MNRQIPYFLSNQAILGSLLALGAIAIFFPSDANINSVDLFVNIMGNIFPPILSYKQRSLFPDATALYFSLSFLLIPAHFALTLRTLNESSDDWAIRLRKIDTQGQLIYRFVMAVVVAMIAIFCLFLNPGYDFNLLPINSNRYALALVGFLFAGGISAQLIAWVYVSLLSIRRYLKRE